MSVSQLLSDLARLGVRIEARNDVLRYAPRSAVTPELADRMNAQKGGLLAILQRDPDVSKTDLPGLAPTTQATPDQAEVAPLFPPDVMEALRAADVCWVVDRLDREAAAGLDPLGPGGWPMGCIDPIELTPCSKCGSLEQWETLAGNWRCQRCEPRTKAQQLRVRAGRVRRTDSQN